MPIENEDKIDSPDSGIDLKVSDDKLEVRLSCNYSIITADDFEQSLQSRLDSMKITAPIDFEAIKNARMEVAANEGNISNLVIAKGKAPVPPQDGQLEWMGEFFTEGYYVDPVTKRIDFHQKIEQRSVEKGQLLVKIISHQEGIEGADVFGFPIKVSRAKKADLRGGPHVAWDGEQKGYCANTAGRVKLVGDLLDVHEVLHIRGDVGNDIGNIKHNGQLLIDGNVEPDFKVEATGDIEVRGLIFASEIECGGYAHDYCVAIREGRCRTKIDRIVAHPHLRMGNIVGNPVH